jgi:hypothetical protein
LPSFAQDAVRHADVVVFGSLASWFIKPAVSPCTFHQLVPCSIRLRPRLSRERGVHLCGKNPLFVRERIGRRNLSSLDVWTTFTRLQLTSPVEVAFRNGHTSGREHNERCIHEQSYYTRSNHSPWACWLFAQRFLHRLIIAHEPRLAVGESFFVFHCKVSINRRGMRVAQGRARVAVPRRLQTRTRRLLTVGYDDAADYSHESAYGLWITCTDSTVVASTGPISHSSQAPSYPVTLSYTMESFEAYKPPSNPSFA